MDTPNISDAEFKLCLIVWEKEPVSGSTLATMCSDSFGWARTTTHTFIRRLVDRGVLKNDKGTVTSLVSKEAAQDAALSEIIKSRFQNSEQELLSVLGRRKVGCSIIKRKGQNMDTYMEFILKTAFARVKVSDSARERIKQEVLSRVSMDSGKEADADTNTEFQSCEKSHTDKVID